MKKQKAFKIEVRSDYSIEACPIGELVVLASSVEEAMDKIKEMYNQKNQFDNGHYWIHKVETICEIGII